MFESSKWGACIDLTGVNWVHASVEGELAHGGVYEVAWLS
jgi:hypothetical protein